MGSAGRPTRPVLRYHSPGGKWRLAPWIIGHFPKHRVYVEPFGGAASVLMQKPRSQVEFYNDLNGEVVNLFRVLRDHGDQLREALFLTPFARAEFHASYEPTEDPVERARRTVVRAQMGFGTSALVRSRTGFRRTSTRSKRAGYADDWASYVDVIPDIVDRLRGVVIENEPATKVIADLDAPDVLIYCDPPYVHGTRGTVAGSNGYAEEMTDEDHRALADVLHAAKGCVVLSGYPSPLYEDLYGSWRCETRPARMQGNSGPEERMEALWLNEAASIAQPQRSLFA